MNDKRDEKLQQIVEWATSQDLVRVVLLTSSLVSPNAPVDQFSDLDIELVVADLPHFLSDHAWLSTFGTVIAQVIEDEEVFAYKHAMRMVLYEDYTKVDFKLYAISEFLREIDSPELPEDWDIGYKVLVDKDGLTKNLKPPTYQSVLIKKPSEAEFAHVFNDFWWDMTYVAKCLARDDLFYAKFMLENMMRTQYLVPILEWSIGIEHQWGITTNKHGRLFKRFLSPAMWHKVEATFSGSDRDDNWRALLAYADLGHELGTELALKLSYSYPVKLENDIRDYLRFVRNNQP
ncbi:aminoglycoside 6-adenylyltransferase [Larkinella harenae]